MPRAPFAASVVPIEPARRLSGPLLFGLLASLACLVVRFTGLDHAGISFCYFKALTGRACFTCGSTRALGLLGRFDVPGAFAIQPLVTIGALALMAWGLADALLLAIGKRTFIRIENRLQRILMVLGAALAVVNWMYLLATGV